MSYNGSYNGSQFHNSSPLTLKDTDTNAKRIPTSLTVIRSHTNPKHSHRIRSHLIHPAALSQLALIIVLLATHDQLKKNCQQ